MIPGIPDTIRYGKNEISMTIEQDSKTESGEVPELPESEN